MVQTYRQSGMWEHDLAVDFHAMTPQPDAEAATAAGEGAITRARRVVRKAERHMARQERCIAGLRRNGHDTALADSLLQSLDLALDLQRRAEARQIRPP